MLTECGRGAAPSSRALLARPLALGRVVCGIARSNQAAAQAESAQTRRFDAAICAWRFEQTAPFPSPRFPPRHGAESDPTCQNGTAATPSRQQVTLWGPAAAPETRRTARWMTWLGPRVHTVLAATRGVHRPKHCDVYVPLIPVKKTGIHNLSIYI
jgi:hypothetical protein